MKKERLLLLSLFVFTMSWVLAQDNTYLQEIAKVVKELRKSNESTYRSAIATLSAAQKPKITLMDEARWAGDEDEIRCQDVCGRSGDREEGESRRLPDSLKSSDGQAHCRILYQLSGRQGQQRPGRVVCHFKL